MADTIPANSSTTVELPINSFVAGTVDDPGDADWYRVALSAGYGYGIWLEGDNAGKGTLHDPLLTLYDSTSFELMSNDDAFGLDSYLYFVPDETADYYLSAAAIDEAYTGTYQLRIVADQLATTSTAEQQVVNTAVTGTIGYVSDVADWRFVQLVAGTTYLFDLVGIYGDGSGHYTLPDPMLTLYDATGNTIATDFDSGVGPNARILYTPTQSGKYFLGAAGVSSFTPYTYLQIVNEAPIGPSLAAGETLNGTIGFIGEVDMVRVTWTAGVRYDISLNCTSPFNPYLELMNSSGVVIADNDNGAGAGVNSRLSFTPTTSGTYYLATRASGYSSTGTYTLSYTAQAPGDGLEPNNTIATATNLGTISGSVLRNNLSIHASDQDLFRITLDHAGRIGDEASIGFLNSQGDLDIALYDINNTSTPLRMSAGAANNERIGLEGLAAGTYLLQVYGHNGAVNPNYSLGVYVSPLVPGPDSREENDTAATATNIGSVADSVMLFDLTAEANDVDWYRFTLAQDGGYGDQVAAHFHHVLGDVDIALYAADGTTLLGSSATDGDDESIGLQGRAAGDYLVRVAGRGGASNPSYELAITADSHIVIPDAYEDNDSYLTATALGTIAGSVTLSHLSVESGDEDWFRFTLDHAGQAADAVKIAYTYALGDVDMALFNFATHQLVNFSATANDTEQISLAGLAAGDYALIVGGLNGASNRDYSLTLQVAPVTIAADRFEQNDTAASATSLGTAGGLRTEAGLTMQAGDDDWYRFTLAQSGRDGDSIGISFLHAQGDIDLQLYDSAGNNVLFRSSGSGNAESISLAGLAAGDYKLRVYGYDGAANPDYSLQLKAATPVVADRYEENDTAAAATDLKTIVNTVSKYNLSVQANDADWYRFSLAGKGQSGDNATVYFTHAQGDVDIELYNAAGTTVLASSKSVGNSEQVSLAGLAAGDYLLKVYGYNGASNPSYDLVLKAAPAIVAPDRFEENDARDRATDLHTLAGPQFFTGLTVQSNDDDWYRFTIGNTGKAGEGVGIFFDGELGDVDMQLFNGSGTTMLRQSTGRGDSEQITFEGLAAGNYLVRVYGSGNQSNPEYAMAINAAAPLPAADRYEGYTMVDLKEVAGTYTDNGLTITPGDVDTYRFTLADYGRASDVARIDFLNSQGDLDLYLYDLSGNLLASSTSTNDFEQISLAGRFGTYDLKVQGYNGSYNGDYDLKVTGPAALREDAYEGNGDRLIATQIREAKATISGATITASDTDYYEFILTQTGGMGDRVTVRADRPFVQVRLMDANGNVLSTALTDNTGTASLTLQGKDAGHYFAEVMGTDQAQRARYDLDVVAEGTATKRNGWTVMVFMNGDNNLEGSAIEDLNEMEASLNRAGVDVVVALDRIPGYDTGHGTWQDTRWGYVSHGTDTDVIGSALTSVADWTNGVGEWDMGDPATLTRFINMAAAEAPADHYMLVIWDHGGGALGGVSFDDTNKASGGLSVSEVRTAIAGSNVRNFDIVGFDACLMAAVEMAAQLDGLADLMVGSELTEPGDGWDYTAVLDYLRSSTSATSLAAKIVNSYVTSYGGAQHLSSVDLEMLPALRSSIDGFWGVMEFATATDWRAIFTARSQAKESDWNDDYVDLGSFMLQVKERSSNAAIDNAAQAVLDALNGMVLTNGGPARLNGLTIVLPKRGETLDSAYNAANYGWLADTDWHDFVAKFLSVTLPAAASYEPGTRDFAESFQLDGRPAAFGNDARETPYQLGTINSAGYAITGLNLDFAGDVDWYTLTFPGVGGAVPSLTVQVLGNVAGVTAELFDSAGKSLGVLTSTGADPWLDFAALAANGTYLLKVTATGAQELPRYELHVDAFGSATVAALPDWAESAGGNNSLAKAWQTGTPQALQKVGGLKNLSLDAADVATGTDGGDWFRIDSSRVTEANANLVTITDATNGADTLVVKVYDLAGNLLAQSSAPGDLSVAFIAQADDVFVQVQATGGTAVRGYTLQALNDSTAPTVTGVLVAPVSGGQPGIYNAGDVLTFLAQFSEAVDVAGAPTLDALIGSTSIHAAYVSGSGSNELRFQYTVQAGDTDTNGVSFAANALQLNGATIADGSGNAAATASVAVADNANFKVDTTAPVVTTLSPSDAATSVPVASNLAVTFNEAITPGTGNIVLKVLGGVAIESFDAAASPRLSFTSTGVTIDPTVNLTGGVTYQVVFEAGTVRDVAGNAFAGSSTWDFTAFLAGQTFNGVAGVDNLVGTAGNDTFATLGGNDTVNAGKGDDFVDGGAGRDYVVFAGLRSSYSVVRTDDAHAVVSGPDGTDTLVNVERLRFDDAYVALDLTGNGGMAYRLYQSALDRAPDLGGLGFQINVLDIGFQITDIAANFVESPEFNAKYGALSNEQFVTRIYQNVLHRAPDAGGLEFHVHNLELGLPRNYLLVQFSESPENQANVIGVIGNGMTYLL